MSIDQQVETLLINTGRIATALEDIVKAIHGGSRAAPAAPPAADEVATKEAAQQAQQAAAPAKPKAEKPAAPPEPPAAAPLEGEPELTFQDLLKALKNMALAWQKVPGEDHVQKSANLLETFGVAKLMELEQAQWAAFIAAAEQSVVEAEMLQA